MKKLLLTLRTVVKETGTLLAAEHGNLGAVKISLEPDEEIGDLQGTASTRLQQECTRRLSTSCSKKIKIQT